MKKAVEIKDLTVFYRDTLALNDVSLVINEGKITGIIGPNGSGKSTLLKGILGIIPVKKGEVKFFGNSL